MYKNSDQMRKLGYYDESNSTESSILALNTVNYVVYPGIHMALRYVPACGFSTFGKSHGYSSKKL